MSKAGELAWRQGLTREARRLLQGALDVDPHHARSLLQPPHAPHRLGRLADGGVASLGRALYHLASIHHAEWFATGGQQPLHLAADLLERATVSPWPYNAPAYIALAATRVAAAGTAAATWARGWVGGD